jgi:ABC-type transport system involved in cytochrome bd biosynthesis fused ATPase/permease subunit
MRLGGTLRFAWELSTSTSRRRGATVAVLSLIERLLTPAAAWAAFERGRDEKLGSVLLLGVFFTLRTFAQRGASARVEAELYDRVIAALLDGDVLRPSPLPNEDARAELGQGIYHSALVLAQDLPMLAADAIGAALLTFVIVAVEPARLVVLAVGLTMVAALLLVWSRSRVQRAVSRAWNEQVQVMERFVDALEGRLEIVAAGQRADFARESRARARAWGAASVHVAAASVLAGRIPLLAIALLVGGAVAGNGTLRGSLMLTLADVALIASVTPAFAGVAQGVHALARSQRWVELVAKVLSAARPPSGRGIGSPKPAWPIAFDRVSFRYEGSDKEALDGVSFAFGGPGVLALTGANGSGKSTCLRLLLALARPTSGRITVAGAPFDAIDADQWRAQAAFLPQRPYLPPQADVRRAVRFLAMDASDETILRALERVGLLPSLRRNGGDPLQVRVDTLSVGERQRVALARMLCRDACVFILDEPDANLDTRGIALVAGLVRELATTGVVVLAAHTPQLIDAADHVIALERGCVVAPPS